MCILCVYKIWGIWILNNYLNIYYIWLYDILLVDMFIYIYINKYIIFIYICRDINIRMRFLWFSLFEKNSK